jgi:anti-sigma regulatory factor (Ser/Thr protein kinase)
MEPGKEYRPLATRRTKRGREIESFILRETRRHPRDLVKRVYEHFGISRQAVTRYIRGLVEDGYLETDGTTRQTKYMLRVLQRKAATLDLKGMEEDEVWRNEIRDTLGDVPENVVDIWHYGITEMVNNAIDHSGGEKLLIDVRRDAVETRVMIADDGIGIFRKIKQECGLEDERHAVLELAKGKLTTDSESHTGEGIFFTSRMFDDFAILSGEVCFSHQFGDQEDWIMERERTDHGTSVFLGMENDSTRSPRDIFELFAAEEDDYGFSKTVVPVRMARQGAEKLISRSQAKRLLARVDRFKTVLFDFRGVEYAGRAFLDEIFRVFVRSHPEIVVLAINTNDELERMIASIRSGEA